jgi:hypothetical protein
MDVSKQRQESGKALWRRSVTFVRTEISKLSDLMTASREMCKLIGPCNKQMEIQTVSRSHNNTQSRTTKDEPYLAVGGLEMKVVIRHLDRPRSLAHFTEQLLGLHARRDLDGLHWSRESAIRPTFISKR